MTHLASLLAVTLTCSALGDLFWLFLGLSVFNGILVALEGRRWISRREAVRRQERLDAMCRRIWLATELRDRPSWGPKVSSW